MDKISKYQATLLVIQPVGMMGVITCDRKGLFLVSHIRALSSNLACRLHYGGLAGQPRLDEASRGSSCDAVDITAPPAE